jgi:DNA-directed RNA polymerase subunit RPC12/RpoP
MSEIDTDYQSNATCPYCAHVDKDSWEIDFGDCMDGDAEVDCPECGEPYIVTRNVTVDYSTRKKLTIEPDDRAEGGAE